MANLMEALITEGAEVTGVTFKKGTETFRVTLQKVDAKGRVIGSASSKRAVSSAPVADIQMTRGVYADGKFVPEKGGMVVLAEAKGYNDRKYPVSELLAASEHFGLNPQTKEFSNEKAEWYQRPADAEHKNPGHKIGPNVVLAFVNLIESE